MVRTFRFPRHADASLDLQGIAVCAGDVRLIAAPDAPLLGARACQPYIAASCFTSRGVSSAAVSPESVASGWPTPGWPNVRRRRRGSTRSNHLDIWLAAAILGVVIHSSPSCGGLDEPLAKSGDRPQRRPKIAKVHPGLVCPAGSQAHPGRPANESGARPLGRTF
jgi:hypothetical protein